MTSLAEVLVTSFWDSPAKASEASEAAIQAAPVLRAEYRHRPEGVITPLPAAGAALGHHRGRQGEGRGADRDVEEEDVLPAGVGGEDSAGQQADRTAQCTHPAPDAEGLVACGSLGEHVHHDGQGGRQHERCPESLQPAHHDEEGVRGGQAASE
jgi:hypothetical protein